MGLLLNSSQTMVQKTENLSVSDVNTSKMEMSLKTQRYIGMESILNLTMRSEEISVPKSRKFTVITTITICLEDSNEWEQMKNGMVLVMSLWDDHDANMLWLDSNYPLDKDPSEPGVNRGPCPEDSGVPAEVEAEFPDATVIFSKVRVGDLDSTY